MSPCPCCGEEGSRRRFSTRGFAVLRCPACGHERVHPMPSEQELAALYARGYFTGEGAGYEDYFGRERAVAEEKARARAALLREEGGLREGARVLELGCADGRFLLAARALGFDAWGVEPSEEARAALPPELRERVTEALCVDASAPPLEALCAFDVLEHLREPERVLAELRPRLAPGCLLCVVVPVVDNANARWLPWSWDQYKPPEHLHFFSRSSLRTLLSRALDARVLAERCAWERPARLVDGVLGGLGGWRARRAEGALWRLAVRRGWLAQERLEDSVLVLARVGETP